MYKKSYELSFVALFFSFPFVPSHKGFRFVIQCEFFEKFLVGGDAVKPQTLYAGTVYGRKLGQAEGFSRPLGQKLQKTGLVEEASLCDYLSVDTEALTGGFNYKTQAVDIVAEYF